jgi:hypothetical protein
MMVLLLPSVVKPGMMQGTAKLYGKLLFWIENVFYLGGFALYSLSMIPYIYFRILINILLVANGPNMASALGIWLAWTVLGLLYLLYVAVHDTYRMVTILCDSKEDGDDFATR